MKQMEKFIAVSLLFGAGAACFAQPPEPPQPPPTGRRVAEMFAWQP